MEKNKYFIVSADALPEVFVKVAEAKRMLQVGEASTVGQAAAMVGSSRSAFSLTIWEEGAIELRMNGTWRYGMDCKPLCAVLEAA